MIVLQVLGKTAPEWIQLVIAAFAGGAFGAAIGALPAFCFTGITVIAGEAANILKGELAGAIGTIEAGQIGVGITGSLAFGPVFGPHVSFAGGAAAAAYAAKKGYMDFGFDYHEAKNIPAALGTQPDVLVVGGIFGILGMAIRQISGGLLAAPWDPIAIAVVLSALFHRLAFGYSLIGEVRGDGILDMSPFEREEMYSTTPGGSGGDVSGEAVTDGGAPAERLAVEPWLPHQYKWSGVAMIGLTTGILGAYIALSTGSPFLGFGISAASLLFLILGVEKIPVTHHIMLPASTAALAVSASGAGMISGAGPVTAVVVGMVFGIICALFGELFQRVFYAHGDTHWDPPAAAIVFGTFLVAVLAIVGVFPSSSWVPLPI
jgi:MFS family permease